MELWVGFNSLPEGANQWPWAETEDGHIVQCHDNTNQIALKWQLRCASPCLCVGGAAWGSEPGWGIPHGRHVHLRHLLTSLFMIIIVHVHMPIYIDIYIYIYTNLSNVCVHVYMYMYWNLNTCILITTEPSELLRVCEQSSAERRCTKCDRP